MKNNIFLKIFKIILELEEGYKDTENNRIYHGIHQEVFDSYRKIKNRPLVNVRYADLSELYDIYYDFFWIKSGCDLIQSIKISYIHFDTSVVFGVDAANKILNSIKVKYNNDIDILKEYIKQRADLGINEGRTTRVVSVI